MNDEPSQETLRKEFAYDSDRGGLIRIQREGEAVTLLPHPSARSDGRVVHGVGGEMWLESRLVWVWHHGPIDEGMDVRHRGTVSLNTVENLYLAPSAGTPRAVESQAKVEAICSRWSNGAPAEDKEALAADFEAGDFGNEEANRIARLLAQEIRKDITHGSYITRETILDGIIAMEGSV